jgi:hypothetical protein
MKYYCRSPLSLFVTIMRCLNKDISTHKHRPSRKIDNLVSMPLLPLKESCCALQKMGGAEVISLCHLTGSAVDQTADLYKRPHRLRARQTHQHHLCAFQSPPVYPPTSVWSYSSRSYSLPCFPPDLPHSAWIIDSRPLCHFLPALFPSLLSIISFLAYLVL